jgi:hypothetical protein
MPRGNRLLLAVAFLVGLGAPAFAEDDPLELFKTRITPILNSPRPSSCTECHLSGVDLKNYIGKNQQETFASLRAAGLIDVNQPDKSKLLEFIQRAPKNGSPIRAEVRKLEYEAFRAWITAAVKDPTLAAARTTSDQLGPSLPLEVVRHTRQSRVIQSFVENIWSEMGRCASCHSPELNRNKIGKNGFTRESLDAISWLVPRNPLATLEKLVDSGHIDLEDPQESEFLTKPAGLVKHGGGPKFAVGSRTDKNFRRFLDDYAAIVNGEYASAEDLPRTPDMVGVVTNQNLRIIDLPETLNRKLLRVDIYRRVGNGWSEKPWATAENPIVGPRKMWQSMVFAVAPRESERARQLKPKQALPAGRYLIKIYVDRQDKTKKDRDYVMGKAEFYGQVEIHGEWKPGGKPPKIVHAPRPVRG